MQDDSSFVAGETEGRGADLHTPGPPQATYAKLREDGRYDFGIVEQAKDRRKDKLVRVGIAATYEEAEAAINKLSGE